MSKKTTIVIIDADNADRRIKGKTEWPNAEAAHLAVDDHQQAGTVMEDMPWRIVKRTEEVLGTYRKSVEAKFVATGAEFVADKS